MSPSLVVVVWVVIMIPRCVADSRGGAIAGVVDATAAVLPGAAGSCAMEVTQLLPGAWLMGSHPS